MPPATTAPAPPNPSPSYPHLAWAAGHALVVLTSIWTALRLATFNTPSTKLISIAYAGALVSWGVVVYKTLGVPTASKTYVNRFLTDENGEYMLLALYWFINKPIYITLFPFAVFSLFHTLTFVRTTFLPPPPKTTNGQPLPQTTSRMLQTFVKRNYESAMLLVAHIEVLVILPYLVLTALLRRNPITSPLIFAHFLRLRYHLSAQTRAAFARLNGQIEAGINHPSCPAPIRSGVQYAKQMIVHYSESVIQPGAAPGGANAAGGATPVAAAQAQAQQARQ